MAAHFHPLCLDVVTLVWHRSCPSRPTDGDAFQDRLKGADPRCEISLSLDYEFHSEEIHVLALDLIAKILSSDSPLTRLGLTGGDKQPINTKAIEAALLSNRTLVSLKLNGFRVDSMLVDALASNREMPLRQLDLGANELGEAASKAIGRLLKASGTVSEIRLDDNALSGGIGEIAAGLEHNTSVEIISLRRCGLRAGDMKPLCLALTRNSALEVLDLGFNEIGCDGVATVADSLQQNCALLELDIANNHLEEEAAGAIARLISSSKGLKTLHVYEHFFEYRFLSGNAGAEMILEAAKSSRTLVYMGELPNCNLLEQFQVEEQLVKNRRLANSAAARAFALLPPADAPWLPPEVGAQVIGYMSQLGSNQQGTVFHLANQAMRLEAEKQPAD